MDRMRELGWVKLRRPAPWEQPGTRCLGRQDNSLVWLRCMAPRPGTTPAPDVISQRLAPACGTDSARTAENLSSRSLTPYTRQAPVENCEFGCRLGLEESADPATCRVAPGALADG